MCVGPRTRSGTSTAGPGLPLTSSLFRDAEPPFSTLSPSLGNSESQRPGHTAFGAWIRQLHSSSQITSQRRQDPSDIPRLNRPGQVPIASPSQPLPTRRVRGPKPPQLPVRRAPRLPDGPAPPGQIDHSATSHRARLLFFSRSTGREIPAGWAGLPRDSAAGLPRRRVVSASVCVFGCVSSVSVAAFVLQCVCAPGSVPAERDGAVQIDPGLATLATLARPPVRSARRDLDSIMRSFPGHVSPFCLSPHPFPTPSLPGGRRARNLEPRQPQPTDPTVLRCDSSTSRAYSHTHTRTHSTLRTGLQGYLLRALALPARPACAALPAVPHPRLLLGRPRSRHTGRPSLPPPEPEKGVRGSREWGSMGGGEGGRGSSLNGRSAGRPHACGLLGSVQSFCGQPSQPVGIFLRVGLDFFFLHLPCLSSMTRRDETRWGSGQVGLGLAVPNGR